MKKKIIFILKHVLGWQRNRILSNLCPSWLSTTTTVTSATAIHTRSRSTTSGWTSFNFQNEIRNVLKWRPDLYPRPHASWSTRWRSWTRWSRSWVGSPRSESIWKRTATGRISESLVSFRFVCFYLVMRLQLSQESLRSLIHPTSQQLRLKLIKERFTIKNIEIDNEILLNIEKWLKFINIFGHTVGTIVKISFNRKLGRPLPHCNWQCRQIDKETKSLCSVNPSFDFNVMFLDFLWRKRLSGRSVSTLERFNRIERDFRQSKNRKNLAWVQRRHRLVATRLLRVRGEHVRQSRRGKDPGVPARLPLARIPASPLLQSHDREEVSVGRLEN